MPTLQEKSFRASDELQRLKLEGEALSTKLSELKKGKRTVPKESTSLRDLIIDKLGCEIFFLCELIEITDEKWQPAIEGYLNTRRFDLILDPTYYRKALTLYERHKRQLNIHGVGLVDGEKVQAAQFKIKPKALANWTESSNPWAKAYVDFLLGDLIGCEDEQDLRKFSRSITPTCMVYQNYAARQTPFHIFEAWHIGSRGHAHQIAQTEVKIQEIHVRFLEAVRVDEELKKHLGLAREALELSFQVQQFDHLKKEYEATIALLESLEARWSKLDHSELEKIEKQIEMLQVSRDQSTHELRLTDTSIGKLQEAIERITEQVRVAQTERDLEFAELAEKFKAHTEKTTFEERYRQEIKDGRTPQKILEVYLPARKGRETQRFNILEEISVLRANYNNQFGFSAPAQGDDLSLYVNEQALWKESHLPQYLEKIATARESALQQLMEDVVHKLRENLDLVQKQFDEINRALRGFHFGHDQYQFTYRVKESYADFEKMIREAAHYENQPLFETDWRNRFKGSGKLEELFNSLVSGSGQKVQDELEEYSDYREYYEYDIKIMHSDGTTSLYSQVNRLKSGGETQTPYYIAVLASLYRLYRLQPQVGKKNERETIGLVLLDEAFNKMDEDHLRATLQFTRKLGLQLIMATPKERAEFIVPHIETCMTVIKDPETGKAFLQDFHRIFDRTDGGGPLDEITLNQ